LSEKLVHGDIVACESVGIEVLMRMTAPFRSILFPTDFSKSSVAIIDHAVGLAKAAGVKIWILNVVPRLEELHGISESYFGPFSDSAIVAFEKNRADLEAERLKALEDFRAKHFASVDCAVAVRSGGVADMIVDFAKEKNVGLIMMPTHAVGRRRQFLIGSTTAKVLHDAPCSVWTSPHPRELSPFHSYRRIVLAIDYRSLSIPLLVRASEFAELFGANLSVFSAIPSGPDVGHELTQRMKKDLESALKARLADCKIKASICLLEGNPGEIICEVAEDIENANLLITGRGRLDEAAGHQHSHNYEIIWNAPCPVITLQDLWEGPRRSELNHNARWLLELQEYP
jgi:nucleotide-binding universal stress UspA family protein